MEGPRAADCSRSSETAHCEHVRRKIVDSTHGRSGAPVQTSARASSCDLAVSSLLPSEAVLHALAQPKSSSLAGLWMTTFASAIEQVSIANFRIGPPGQSVHANVGEVNGHPAVR